LSRPNSEVLRAWQSIKLINSAVTIYSSARCGQRENYFLSRRKRTFFNVFTVIVAIAAEIRIPQTYMWFEKSLEEKFCFHTNRNMQFLVSEYNVKKKKTNYLLFFSLSCFCIYLFLFVDSIPNKFRWMYPTRNRANVLIDDRWRFHSDKLSMSQTSQDKCAIES